MKVLDLRILVLIQKTIGVKTPPIIMKNIPLSTLHSHNHNGGGAEPEFWFLSK